MAKKKVNDNFTSELISSLNKEHGSKVAYNLAHDTSPTHVKRWISTGSKLLDYIASNRQTFFTNRHNTITNIGISPAGPISPIRGANWTGDML